MKKAFSKLLLVFGVLGIGVIITVLTYPLFKPDIKLTSEAPKIGNEQAKKIEPVELEPGQCQPSSASPDCRYEVEYQEVDDRGWIEKLLGLSYAGNGLTRIVVKDKTNQAEPIEVGVFLDVDPGSGRSYITTWSENSKYLAISGMIRTERRIDASETREINFVYIIDEARLYSR